MSVASDQAAAGSERFEPSLPVDQNNENLSPNVSGANIIVECDPTAVTELHALAVGRGHCVLSSRVTSLHCGRIVPAEEERRMEATGTVGCPGSRASEMLSLECVRLLTQWQLHATELQFMRRVGTTKGGLPDYVLGARLGGRVGVSVTRAFGYRQVPLTQDACVRLLTRKLGSLHAAQRNAEGVPAIEFGVCVLHVWVRFGRDRRCVLAAMAELARSCPELVVDTAVLVSVTNMGSIF